jgi:hypothetical protein
MSVIDACLQECLVFADVDCNTIFVTISSHGIQIFHTHVMQYCMYWRIFQFNPNPTLEDVQKHVAWTPQSCSNAGSHTRVIRVQQNLAGRACYAIGTLCILRKSYTTLTHEGSHCPLQHVLDEGQAHANSARPQR